MSTDFMISKLPVRLFLCPLLICWGFLLASCGMSASTHVLAATPPDPSSIAINNADLQLWLKADSGVTLTNGRVAAWADQSRNGNNVTQTTAANEPGYLASGKDSAVSFEFSGKPSDYMVLPSSLSTNRESFSAFAVVECQSLAYNQCLFCWGTNNANLYLQNNGLLTMFNSKVTPSTLRPTTSLCVIGYTSGSSGKMWMNGESSVVGGYPAGSYQGGFLGAINGSDSYAMMNVREVVQYGHSLSTDEVSQLLKYFTSKYKIPMAPSTNVICDGDSITAGISSTLNQSYPLQMAHLAGAETTRIRQFGRPSKTMEYIAAQAPTSVDLCYDSKVKNNVLVIFAGTNSIAKSIGNESGETAYASLVAYCQARKAAHPGLKIIVVTMLPRTAGGGGSGVFATEQGIFNTDIRNGYTAYADGIADVAADPDFSSVRSNVRMSADETHPSNAGYGAIANTVWKAIQTVAPPPATANPAKAQDSKKTAMMRRRERFFRLWLARMTRLQLASYPLTEPRF